MIELLPVALVLLPLFPATLWMNRLLQALPVGLRAVALVALPVAGAYLLGRAPVPAGAASPLAALAVVTALLYAWRLLAVREAFVWARLQASSAWPLIWLAWLHGMPAESLLAVALALSLPPAALTSIGQSLARRIGGAYLGLRGRLGPAYPRLAGLWVLALIAALAAPPAPGFFAILAVMYLLPGSLVFAVLATWLMWSWAAALQWQHGLYGPPWPRRAGTEDLSATASAVWLVLAVAAVILGFIGVWAWPMH